MTVIAHCVAPARCAAALRGRRPEVGTDGVFRAVHMDRAAGRLRSWGMTDQCAPLVVTAGQIQRERDRGVDVGNVHRLWTRPAVLPQDP